MEAVMRIRSGFVRVALVFGALLGIAAKADAGPITLNSVILTETQDDNPATWCISACNNAIWGAAAGFFLPAGQSLILSQTGTGGISQIAPAGLDNPYNFATNDAFGILDNGTLPPNNFGLGCSSSDPCSITLSINGTPIVIGGGTECVQ
jgi:hypothetical protein